VQSPWDPLSEGLAPRARHPKAGVCPSGLNFLQRLASFRAWLPSGLGFLQGFVSFRVKAEVQRTFEEQGLLLVAIGRTYGVLSRRDEPDLLCNGVVCRKSWTTLVSWC
jgi:hypothetical protein